MLIYPHLTDEEPEALFCAAICPRWICFNGGPLTLDTAGTAVGSQTQCRQSVARYTARSWRVLLCGISYLDCEPLCSCSPSPSPPPRPLSGSVTQEKITVTTLLAVCWDLGER